VRLIQKKTARRVGVLAGGFNPVTRAHVALVDAARGLVDRVICVVPRNYPHKEFHGATLSERVAMVEVAAPDCEIAVTDGGLFIEIARELRGGSAWCCPTGTGIGSGTATATEEIHFLCGRDAAERVLSWDYGDARVETLLEEFSLMVAGRNGEFVPPVHLLSRVRSLTVPPEFDLDSSSEVRRRIAASKPWEHLVPEAIVEMVGRIYTSTLSNTTKPAAKNTISDKSATR
jgi:nicotinic acid mononucleotide adenylyltransferase